MVANQEKNGAMFQSTTVYVNSFFVKNISRVSLLIRLHVCVNAGCATSGLPAVADEDEVLVIRSVSLQMMAEL